MPALSIIIPTYNGVEHLRRCLPSVKEHAPAGTQVLVIDDGSTDETVAWAGREFPEFEIVELGGNQGFCGAVNEGLRRARGDVVELLNNDTEVCAGWADHCLKHFADATVGSVAPLVLRMDEASTVDSAGQAYHICGWASDRGHGRPLATPYLTASPIFGPSGSSGFYRRSALAKTGGLLPDYGAYFEDTDLAFRLRWAGFRSVFEPAARVYHKGSASYKQKSNRVIRLLSRNEELVWWINLPLGQLLLGLLPHFGFVSVRFLRKLFCGGVFPFVHGKLQALCAWRTIWQHRKQVHKLAGASRALDLALTRNAGVLSHGVIWLLRRQCP